MYEKKVAESKKKKFKADVKRDTAMTAPLNGNWSAYLMTNGSRRIQG